MKKKSVYKMKEKKRRQIAILFMKFESKFLSGFSKNSTNGSKNDSKRVKRAKPRII